MFQSYGPQKRISDERLLDIEQANQIINEVRRQGYTLTLRQLYYQHVARGLIPNSERSYKNLGTLIADGRLQGLISWHSIEDRGRGISRYSYNEDPASALDGIEWGIIVDYWARQDTYLECWVEKDALSEIVGQACRRLRVPHMPCKGYMSLSEAWAAGQRYREAAEQGKNLVLLHLGDHDPSGLDMTRVNGVQLGMFSEAAENFGLSVEVRRLALNMDQVRQFNPPPNPAKTTDSRARGPDGYVALYGNESWELDALHPQVIDRLIQDAIADYVDEDSLEDAQADEKRLQAGLKKLRRHWPEVEAFLANIGQTEE